MQANVAGWKLFVLGAMAFGAAASPVQAATKVQKGSTVHMASSSHVASTRMVDSRVGTKRIHTGGRGRKAAFLGGDSYASGGLQCVPFARENSGIELSGNAWAWWSAADGVYERGSRPEIGSVLNFRSNGRMHSGHVAVVTNVENPRLVEIDHANWGGPGGTRGGISRNVRVVDVSPANDWSAVRVALGRSGDFGSIYPTYGFIYDRPDRGTMVANRVTAPMPVLANAAPRDLRPAYDRADYGRIDGGDEPVEVAEATTRSSYRHGRATVHRAGASRSAATAVRHAGGRKHTRG